MVFEHICRLDQLIPKSLLLSFEEDEESLDGKEAETKTMTCFQKS